MLSTIINWLEVEVWLHAIAGITWIGLLYYFSFMHLPAAAKATGPNAAATRPMDLWVAPATLVWYRWSAVATWVTGALALSHTIGFWNAAGLGLVGEPNDYAATVIGAGAWLGTLMLINLWVLIGPNQQKALGMQPVAADARHKAEATALLASRANALLSIPMLMCMTAFGHGLPFL